MAQTGTPPRSFAVHHIDALSVGGSNEQSNLVLVHDDPEHKALNHQQATARTGFKVGDARTIDMLHPPRGTSVYRTLEPIGAMK